MKIVVGGSYHNPNWQEVKKVMEELQSAGHVVIAPGGEWEPININDEFVKFKGENEIPREILQSEFNRKFCEEADAFVIVDGGGYLGYTVTQEIMLVLAVNLTLHRRFLIYFTEEPTVFKEIEKGIEAPIVFPSGKRMKFIGPDELRERLGLNITQEEYDKLYPLHCKLYEIFNNYPGVCKIGIDELFESIDVKELPSIPGTGNGRRIF